MKPFSLIRLSLLLASSGALLLFTPECKAQSEVSPDHFDGTDSWEVAARKPVAPNAKAAAEHRSYQAQNKKADSGASMKLAAIREDSNSTRHNAVAIQDKRKTAVVRKPDQK
jgi:hypothetical protein